MTAPDDRTVISLRTTDDLLDAVPYLLGFHPRQSLLLAALTEDRGKQRMRMAARIDLPPAEHESAVAHQLVGSLARDGADSAFVVIYRDDGPAGPDAADHRLLDLLEAQFDLEGIDVWDAVLVTAGRAWSLVCLDPRCCPPDGRPRPTADGAPTPVQTSLVAAGAVARGSRDDLALEIAYEPGLRSAAVQAAIARVEQGPIPYWRDACVEVAELVARREAGDATPIDEILAARILVAMHHWVRVRDELALAGSDPPPHDRARALATELVRVAPKPYDAAPATVLAWLAYEAGDGSMAQVALDRALDSDPFYRFALMIRTLLDNAVAPIGLADMRRDAKRDRRAARGAGSRRARRGRW